MKKPYQVQALELHNSEITLERRFSPFPWENFQKGVSIDGIVDRGDEHYSVNQVDSVYSVAEGIAIPGRTLKIENAIATLRVPYSRTLDLHVYDESVAKGKWPGGNLEVDKTSEVAVKSPWSYRKNLGPFGRTALSVAEDGLYIGYMTVPTFVGVGLLVKLFGGNPTEYIHWGALLSAGAYVGMRGTSKRALITSAAIATAISFGPELKELFTEGLDAGMKAIASLENAWKIICYLASWGGGEWIRKYRDRKTLA